MQTQKITRDIILIRLGGVDSNIYLIGKELMIDTGTGFHKSLLERAFSLWNLSFENISRIINTHGHFDHVGGNCFFPKAKIGIHKSDAYILETGDNKASCAEFFNSKLEKRKVDFKLQNGDIVRAKNIKLEVIHTPGHTEGSICLYFPEEKILISGDMIFAGALGRTDLIGGDSEEMKDSLKKLSKFEIEKILPGHGPIVANNGNEHIKKAIRFFSR